LSETPGHELPREHELPNGGLAVVREFRREVRHAVTVDPDDRDLYELLIDILDESDERVRGTFAFELDGDEVHRVDAGPDRAAMREATVWLLTFYDETDGVDSPASFQKHIREQRNRSLGDFA